MLAPHLSRIVLKVSSVTYGYPTSQLIPCVLTPLSCTGFPFLSTSWVPLTESLRCVAANEAAASALQLFGDITGHKIFNNKKPLMKYK